MLAKLWKKVLLAICIIACIFNIMSKLVNRHSLKENLESANDGITVFDIFKKDDVQVSESEAIIEGVINQETPTENTEKTTEENSTTVVIDENTTENEEIVSQEGNAEVVEEQNTEEVIDNQTTAEESETQNVTAEESNTEENKTFKFSDFTIIF